MFGLIDRVRRQRSESCTKVPERREYDDSGMPIPQCEAEKLQMRFHMTPRLHAAIPGGLHNNYAGSARAIFWRKHLLHFLVLPPHPPAHKSFVG